jgi:hypothetical protein
MSAIYAATDGIYRVTMTFTPDGGIKTNLVAAYCPASFQRHNGSSRAGPWRS